MAEPCNVILVHGAFQGSFAWKFLKSKLESYGHSVWAPDLCGNTLSEDITQISEIIFKENRSFIVIGHSYGGLVVTGVAKRTAAAALKIRALVYLDAPIPVSIVGNSQSLIEILGPEAAEAFNKRTKDQFVDPFPSESFGLDSEIHSDIISLHSKQSIECFSEPCPSWNYSTDPLPFPVFYIQCSPNEFNCKQLSKAKALKFNLLFIHESGHCPMITHVDELFNLLANSVLF